MNAQQVDHVERGFRNMCLSGATMKPNTDSRPWSARASICEASGRTATGF
jgi:hypothetical protein